jgi:hypothetical protein
MSQRFYPVTYEYGRLLRAVGAAVAAFVAASALPSMPSWLGVLVRGTAVVAVMGVLLAATRFFNPLELRELYALRRRRAGPIAPPGADTTEVAGEIVAVDVSADAIPGATDRKG